MYCSAEFSFRRSVSAFQPDDISRQNYRASSSYAVRIARKRSGRATTSGKLHIRSDKLLHNCCKFHAYLLRSVLGFAKAGAGQRRCAQPRSKSSTTIQVQGVFEKRRARERETVASEARDDLYAEWQAGWIGQAGNVDAGGPKQ